MNYKVYLMGRDKIVKYSNNYSLINVASCYYNVITIVRYMVNVLTIYILIWF